MVPVVLEPGAKPVVPAVIVKVAVAICGMLVEGISVIVPEVGDTLNHVAAPRLRAVANAGADTMSLE